MSARQNKKHRKGRNSANNRERTVTTLTEDPNTPYLIPTPSEEPPGGHLSAHLGTKAHSAPMGSQPYQMSSNFGGFQTYPGTFSPQQPYFPPSQSQTMQQQQSTQQYQPPPPLPHGKDDLEILQNLKQLILNNQHPIFRPLPQPAALAKLYKGLPAQPQPATDSGVTSNPGLASATSDSARLPTRRPSKDNGSVPQQNNPRAHKSDSTLGDQAEDSSRGNKGNLSRSDSWTTKQPPPYSESGRPDSDRTPTSRGGAASMALGQPDTRPTTTPFIAPGDVRDRGAAANTHEWSWQDRNHRRPDYDRPPHHGRQQSYQRLRRVSSASDHHRPMADDPPIRRGGPVTESSQSHVPVDSRASSGVVRSSDASDRPFDESAVDSKRSVDYPLHPDARVLPLASRIEGAESFATPSNRSGDLVGSRVSLPASSGLTLPDAPVHGAGHPSSRQPASDSAGGGGGGGDSYHPPSRANSRPLPHHPGFNKKKFQKNPPHSAGPNNQSAPSYNGPASDLPGPRSGQGRPPSPSLPPSAPGRSLNPRSSSVDGRRGRFPSPVGNSRGWDHRGPPSGRDVSRDRPPAGYRGDYEPDINPMRYGDRSYGRDYSPPPTHGSFPAGERVPSVPYAPPSSGIPPGRDWSGYTGSYPPGNRRDWNAAEEDAYVKPRNWEGRPPPASSERDRYDYPPRSSNWVERDYAGRDSYPPGPPPAAVDDRYSDRGRPPPSVYPPYNRVTRPRSPSPPLRRSGPDSLDDRPPVKRPREEYDPVDYYPPPSANRRGGPPPGEYTHPPPPPRPASPGPPGSGPSWPPPPSSGSTGGPSGAAGLPSDRDYRYPPPVSGSYDRPRSPGPPRGRPPYSRGGGYGRDGGRNAYPPRP